MPTLPEQTTTDEFMERLLKEKKIALDFRNRRNEEWDDNYELYRNKVKTNRLTQRQAVNIPLMKETIKTLLSKIDDPPSIEWKELEQNQEKELIMQEMWNNDFDEGNFEGVDLQDKKTNLLYGRSFIKLNFTDKFSIDALDIYDVAVDPLINPLDLESARFLIHGNIFKSLREILAEKKYSSKAKNDLKIFLSSPEGILQTSDSKEELEKKQERLKAMGVEEKDFNQFSAGEIIVNLTEHYTWLWDNSKKKFIRYVVLYANDKIRLLEEPLEDLLGVNFLPFVSWGEDIETQDYWSDGPADLVRVPNKILNIFFSQMIENRTLKNFQMHWFDSTIRGYQPQTFDPGPGRMLPAPGKPQDVIMPVDISGLEDTLTQIDFLIRLVEKGTSATAIEKGVSEKKQITLGEVQTLLGQSMEKAITMAKFYRRSREELAMKWYKIKDANVGNNEKTTLYKTSSKGKLWPKVVYGKDWKSKAGYKAIARSTSEQEAEKVKGIQKWAFIKQQFPDNPIINKIAQKRVLEIGDLTSQELREVEEYEKKKMTPVAPPIAPPTAIAPEEQEMVRGIQQQTAELTKLQT